MLGVEKGADVNCKIGEVTPIFWAIMGSPKPYVDDQPSTDRIQTIKLLLKNGCCITNADSLLKQALKRYDSISKRKHIYASMFMKHIVKLLLPKIKNWQTYNFSDWKEGRELCIEEQTYLLTVQQALNKYPNDIQRYVIEFCD